MNRIIALTLSERHMSGKELQAKLEEEFDPKDVPGLRTVYQYVSTARKEAERNTQDEPWSLGTMDKTSIPWEATVWLLESYKECEERVNKGEQLWPLTNPYLPARIERLEPQEGGWVFLTNRQAKWLWRLRSVVPTKGPDPFCELCRWADQYAYAEMIAEYLGQYLDTRRIDADLMIYLDVTK